MSFGIKKIGEIQNIRKRFKWIVKNSFKKSIQLQIIYLNFLFIENCVSLIVIISR